MNCRCFAECTSNRMLRHREKMEKKALSKRHDDYLPGERREEYVARRSAGIGRTYRRIAQGFTIASPTTKEYRWLKKYEQVRGHIKYLDKLYPDHLRFLGVQPEAKAV